MYRIYNSTRIAIKSIFCAVISYVSHRFSNKFLNIYSCIGCDFAHNHNDTCCAASLACNTGTRILTENIIKYCVGYFVTYFIGMSFGYRFTCKKYSFHFIFLSFRQISGIKKPPTEGGRTTSHLSGFSTLQMQVAGFHSASHSTTLDKIKLFTHIVYHIFR